MTRHHEEGFTLLENVYDDDIEIRDKQPVRRASGVSKGIALALFAFVVLDILAYLYIARILFGIPAALESNEMEFRNPYVGLDELYSLGRIKPSKYDRLTNVPRLASQISRAEPSRVLPLDVHRWLSDFGVLSPPDRHLQVSSTIHTILQFSVLDYGMEKCSLIARLPSRNDVLPHPYSFIDIRGTVRLNICEVDAKRPLDETKISWKNKPPCIRQLGTIDARIGGEVQMEPFPCKAGEFLGYEVSCASETPGCALDVWSNHNATWGVFMYQYQTV